MRQDLLSQAQCDRELDPVPAGVGLADRSGEVLLAAFPPAAQFPQAVFVKGVE